MFLYASAYDMHLGITAYVAYIPILCYCFYMAKTLSETATAAIRIYPSSRRKLNIMAAKKELTLAELVAHLISLNS